MTYVTEILADESGIQYQGVKDKTGSTGTYPITGLITGKFRRGRFDKPMTITNANIRAMLGYDPKNPCYTAVQDALSQGVPSVQVLRLKKANTIISCFGATNFIMLDIADFLDATSITVTVNDDVATFDSRSDFVSNFGEVFNIPNLYVGEFYEFSAYGSMNYRLSITTSKAQFKTPTQVSDGENPLNPTFLVEGKTIYFCFAVGV